MDSNTVNETLKEIAGIAFKLLPLWLIIFAWSVRVEGFMNNEFVSPQNLADTKAELIKEINKNPNDDYRQYLETRFDNLEKQLDEIKAGQQ